MHIRPIRMFLSEKSTLTHPTIACVHHSMLCYGCRMSVLVILCVHPDTPVLATFVSTCMCKHVSLLRALGLQPRISPLCMSVSGQSGYVWGCSDVCFGVLCGCTYSCAHPVMSLGTHLHIIRMCAFAPYLRMLSFWVILGCTCITHIYPLDTPVLTPYFHTFHENT